jgi:hypothetical protein
MNTRFIIKQIMYGPPDKDGRCSHDNTVVYPNGKTHRQSFFADPAKTMKRLRHNLAKQFWFDRKRIRLALQGLPVSNR